LRTELLFTFSLIAQWEQEILVLLSAKDYAHLFGIEGGYPLCTYNSKSVN